MAKTNAANERIKRDYLRYLKDARGRDESTLDRVAKSLARFEQATGMKDFKRFNQEQAVAFKRKLADADSMRSGGKLSKATIDSTLRDLRAFYEWLSHQPGFKRRITFADAEYFCPSKKDTAIARARRDKAVPTPEQVEHVLATMPLGTPLERRDRALVAFAATTAARVNALASFRLGDVNRAEACVEQDARHVRTKFAKSFRTYFMPVVSGAMEIVESWVQELGQEHLRGPSDPLFPATEIGLGENGGFQPIGLARTGWATTQPIRDIFRRAFEGAGLPYYNPHSFRDMLVHHAMKLDLTPEQMKAWSQNLGHSDVLTTFTSYGQVPVHRQGELIRARSSDAERSSPIAALEAALAELKRSGTHC